MKDSIGECLCTKTIYNYIFWMKNYQPRFVIKPKIILHKYLLRKGRRNKKHNYLAPVNPNKTSITKRPKIVNKRQIIGD